MAVEDTFKIYELIPHFANSFDLKDWEGLQRCLTDTIRADYSDLRGTPPQTLTAADYVKSRRDSLENLTTHHLSGNVEVEYTDATHATCRASMVIWRRSSSDEFTTHCVYIFELIKDKFDWKISGITQKVLWNEGDASIHKDARQK